MNQYTWDVLDGFVEGANSKVVILNTVHDEVPVIILGENLGHWDKQSGLWWSNWGYKPRPTYAPTTTSSWSARTQQAYDTFTSPEATPAEQYEGCIVCFIDIEGKAYCEWCRTCQDCAMNINDCLCLEVS